MPIVTSANPAVVDLAERLQSEMGSSLRSTSATLDTRSAAFDWAGGPTPSPLRLFNSQLITGMSYSVDVVKPSATPAGKVAPGAPKPLAVTITPENGQLGKYAGLATIQVEQWLGSAGLLPAIESSLFDQALASFEIDVAAELSNAALSASGATWSAAVLAAIGQLPAANVVVVSPADLPEILAPTSGYSSSTADAQVRYFGLGLVPLPGLPQGTAYVMRSSALTIFESTQSPLLIVDPFSGSDRNLISVVSDVFAACTLTSPGAAVATTVVP